MGHLVLQLRKVKVIKTMFGIKKIKSLFKNDENHKSIRFSKKKQSLTNIKRDWSVILLVFSLLVIISLVFSIYLFSQISKGEIFIVHLEKTDGIEAIDKELLQKTLSFFEDKENRFNELRENKPIFVDPSL